MAIRFGDYVFSPGNLFLPMALAFFLVLTWRRLYPELLPRKRQAFPFMSVILISGLAGAFFYGAAMTPVYPTAGHGWISLPLGSFGGYWCVLVGAALSGLALRIGMRRAMDAVTPGLAAGGAAARMGCYFNGCCRGIAYNWYEIELAYFWPLLDSAALVAVFFAVKAVERRHRSGAATAVFLILYAMMRSTLEVFRLGRQNIVFFFMVLQVAVGVILLLSNVFRAPTQSPAAQTPSPAEGADRA